VITDVEVEDYQAIRKASLKLGRFTVVTGPTGSGKSGLIRAMRLVAFNARGTSYIRHGAKKCAAALGFEREGVVVGIERGARGADKYRVARPADVPDDPVQVDTYTKLAGAVPPDVAKLLGLREINFAGQFDRPYLLTESGGQVARVLGELTNVTLVFDAAREANRRKLETQRDLRQAETLLGDLREQAKGFRGLKDRLAAVTEAAVRLDAMGKITEQRNDLDFLASSWADARHLVEKAEARMAALEVPSAERLEQLQEQLERLRMLSSSWEGVQEDLAAANEAARRWHSAHVEAEEALHEALVAAGTCPTCGQAVSGLWRSKTSCYASFSIQRSVR
jgi:DNA repair exonuclease SbcCD ATPase subunit